MTDSIRTTLYKLLCGKISRISLDTTFRYLSAIEDLQVWQIFTQSDKKNLLRGGEKVC